MICLPCPHISIARILYTLPERLALLDIICSFAVNPMYLINIGLTTNVLDAYSMQEIPNRKMLTQAEVRGEEKKIVFYPDLQALMMQNLLATVPNVIAVNRHTYSWEAVACFTQSNLMTVTFLAKAIG